jgi:hypothetical protein
MAEYIQLCLREREEKYTKLGGDLLQNNWGTIEGWMWLVTIQILTACGGIYGTDCDFGEIKNRALSVWSNFKEVFQRSNWWFLSMTSLSVKEEKEKVLKKVILSRKRIVQRQWNRNAFTGNEWEPALGQKSTCCSVGTDSIRRVKSKIKHLIDACQEMGTQPSWRMLKTALAKLLSQNQLHVNSWKRRRISEHQL